MNDLTANTLTDSITTSITTDDTSSFIQSVTGICSSGYYNPFIAPYDSYNYTTITTSAYPTKLETNSNELKINIKKFQIKFNFSL